MTTVGTAFTAIKVGQGDAFFLSREGRKVLVDGGRSTRAFPHQFMKATGTKELTVLVCTHNDRDHAGGVLGFLLADLHTDEVWLPGSWTDRLMDVLMKPGSFLAELMEDVHRLESRPSQHRISLESLGHQYLHRTVRSEYNSADSDVELELSRLNEALENALDIEQSGGTSPQVLPSHHQGWQPSCGRRFSWKYEGKAILFVQAMSAANTIRQIAIAAFRSGAQIRWFDVSSVGAGGGIPGFLIPVNSKEIASVRRPRRGALEFLALTRANKGSLVFASPPDALCPGVLFTSDSDLSFRHPVSWCTGMAITAPHHGSEANAAAYRRACSEGSSDSDLVWIRSDGRFRCRPGRSYLNAPGRRYCTRCRSSANYEQDVKLTSSGCWTPLRARICGCR